MPWTPSARASAGSASRNAATRSACPSIAAAKIVGGAPASSRYSAISRLPMCPAASSAVSLNFA